MAFYLSKSGYCSALQCPKMLWMKKHMGDQFDDSVLNEAILEMGNEVGDPAMGLFGAYTEVPFGDLGEMIRTTQALLSSGEKIIAEASFSYNGLFCSVDILKNAGDGRVEIYEVKSSTSVKDIYVEDASYQSYVLARLGYRVERVCVVHIDGEYERIGELELQKLFHIADITETALSKQDEIEAKIAALEQYMRQTEEPADEIGPHCFAPYECGFFHYCARALPRPNVFALTGARTSTKFKHYKEGHVTFEALRAAKGLTSAQKMQIEHELCDCPPYIDAPAICDFLQQLSYPLYFLDFESYQPAVPLYPHSRPFEQIVFQYSLHYIESEGGALCHRQYLAYPGQDPRRALAEQLCRDIPLDVCVTVYNMSFEKGRICSLAKLYPDLSAHLMNIHDHIVDLMIPFRQKMYYCRAMQGSYSIKYVLPALFPDDPQLDYHSLEGVHNGSEASNAFKKMAQMNPEELETCRANLLRYCGLDTLAMVKIWQKLREAAAGTQQASAEIWAKV